MKNKLIEEWSYIPDLPNEVQVSSLGRIKVETKTRSTTTLGNATNKYRYFHYKGKDYPVDKLVANAFVSNPEGHTRLKHLNGDVGDNRSENLKWISNEEAERKKRRMDTKERIYCKELDKVFGSMRSATFATRLPQEAISYAIANNVIIEGLSFVKIDPSDPIAASHDLVYFDFDRIVDILTKSKSEAETKKLMNK